MRGRTVLRGGCRHPSERFHRAPGQGGCAPLDPCQHWTPSVPADPTATTDPASANVPAVAVDAASAEVGVASPRPARRSKKSEVRKAEVVVGARMTVEARDALRTIAASAGCGPSTYLARMVDKELGSPGATSRANRKPPPPEALVQAAALTRRIGELTGMLKQTRELARVAKDPGALIKDIDRTLADARVAVDAAREAANALRGE